MFSVTGALILSISYGYQIEHLKPDPMVRLGEEALFQFSLAAQTGKWLVDVLPFRTSTTISPFSMLKFHQFASCQIGFLE